MHGSQGEGMLIVVFAVLRQTMHHPTSRHVLYRTVIAKTGHIWSKADEKPIAIIVLKLDDIIEEFNWKWEKINIEKIHFADRNPVKIQFHSSCIAYSKILCLCNWGYCGWVIIITFFYKESYCGLTTFLRYVRTVFLLLYSIVHVLLVSRVWQCLPVNLGGGSPWRVRTKKKR